MHTAEHIINQAMCRLFDTGRSINAHVERKKSRLDFHTTQPMGDKEAQLLEEEVNRIIRQDLPVTYLTTTRQEAEQYDVDLSRIPHDSSEAVRIVQVGDYDTRMRLVLHAKLNMVMKMMIGSKLQQGLDQMAEQMAKAFNGEF